MLKDRLIGIAIGLFGPFVILFGIQLFKFPYMNFGLFLQSGWISGSIAPFLQLAALFNLAPFFLFINSKRPAIAQGILLSTILWGLVIVYFTLR
jgi:hypothetical protein